MDVVKRLVVRI